MSPDLITQPVLLTSEEIAAMPAEPLGTLQGVVHRRLWRSGKSMAGVLSVRSGHHLGAHTHRRHDHHVWVLEGSASVLGRVVGPGTYVHIPSGVEHDFDASDTDGCTIFYLYVSEEPEPDA